MALLMHLVPQWGCLEGWALSALLTGAPTRGRFSMVVSNDQIQDSLEKTFSEARSRSCQSLKARAWKLSQDHICHILLLRATMEPAYILVDRDPVSQQDLWLSLIYHRQRMVVVRELCYFKYSG